jgi:hypothetical protein
MPELTRRALLGGASAVALLAGTGEAEAFLSARLARPGGLRAPITGAATARMIAIVRVSNYGPITVRPNAPVTFAQPFASGDVPSTSAIQLRTADGRRRLGWCQQDQESTWLQDGSTKVAAISFRAPDNFPPPATITAISWRRGVVIVTAPRHGLPRAGGLVNIQNVAETPYTGMWPYTYVDADTFTYRLPAVTFSATTRGGSQVVSDVPELGQNVNGMAIDAATILGGAVVEGYGNTFLWSSQAAGGGTRRGVVFRLSPPTPGTPRIRDVMGQAHPATAALVVEYQIWSVPGVPDRRANVRLADIAAGSDIKLYFTDGPGLDYLGGDIWQVSVNDIIANGHGAAWNPPPYDRTGWASTALTTTGNTVRGSNKVTNLAATAGITVGQYIVDNDWTKRQTIRRGAQVAASDGATVILTAPAAQSVTGLSLSFVNGPNRGWEVIRSGPVCTEWRFWSHLSNTATGAWHPYLQGFIYLRCWGMTRGLPARPILEISGGWYQPNIWGKNPNSAPISANPTDVYMSISSADDFVFAAYRSGTTPNQTPGPDWTMIPHSGADQLITEYRITAAPLANLNAALTAGAGGQTAGIGDAVVAARAGIAPRLDGSAHINGGFRPSLTVSLSTNNANDIVFVIALVNNAGGGAYPVTGISSPNIPASAWHLRKRITLPGPDYLDEWYAIVPSGHAAPLSNEPITVTFTGGGGSYMSIDVFAVRGAKLSAPFDANPSLPAVYPPPPQNEYLMAVTLYDGKPRLTALNSWGGAHDPRVASIDLGASPSPVNTANGRITLTPAQYNRLFGQGGMRGDDSTNASTGRIPVLLSIARGGSLPGGLRTDTVYWLCAISEFYTYTGYQISFTPSPADAWNASGVIRLSSAGSGVMTITPLACSFPTHAGLALDPVTAGRTWRHGVRPTLLAAHDFLYLTQKSRALPPYLPTVKVNKTPSHVPLWSEGSQFWESNLGGVGQALNDDRIGYVTYHSTLELFKPFDIGYHQLNLGIAANWMEDTYHLHDETSGLIPVNNVTQYPDLGAPLGSNAGGQFTIRIATDASGRDLNGSSDFAPGSQHSPNPQMIPYLKTGDALWLESTLDDWRSCRAQSNGTYTIGDFTAYAPWNWLTFYPPETIGDSIFGNGRGQGWCARSVGWAIHVIPARRPEHQFIRDAAAQDAQVPMLMVQHVIPPAAQWCGTYCDISALNIDDGPNKGATFTQFACFMNSFQYQGWGMEAWRNEYPGWLDFFAQYFYRWAPGFFDNTASTNGNYPNVNDAPQPDGCLWTSGLEGLPVGFFPPVSKTWFANWDQCFAAMGQIGLFDRGVVTRGSNQIAGVSNSGPFSVFAQAFFVNGPVGKTGIGASFPAYTCLKSRSGSTLTVQAFPGEPGDGDAIIGSNGAPIWITYSWVPVPWPGIAKINADPVLSNELSYAFPGGAPPNSPISYYCIHTAALALGSILYGMTGNPVFANCTPIYDEIRRRQYPGSGPWDRNPLVFDGYPHFSFAPIGRKW